MIDVAALLAPTAAAPPCGADLAHEAEFVELEQLAQGKPERAVGKTVVAAEPPPWREVGAKAAALLARTKDLRIAMLLLRAELHGHGVQGLLGGLQLVHGLLDRYWAELHPLFDADDADDPTMRLSALAPLGELPNSGCVVVRELRDQVVLRSREHGATTVRDVETALGKLAPRPGMQAPPLAQIEAAVGHAGSGLPPVAATLAALRALGALLDARVGAARAPDLKPLATTLGTLALLMPEMPANAATGAATDASPQAPANVTQEPSMQADAARVPPIAQATGAGAAAPAAASGSIHCKEDALALLTRIIDYLERHEPSNPAPLLLRRGRRFMTMGFVDIVKEIAPDSIAKLDLITGPRDAS